MAKIEILLPWILSWEGGFVNDPRDSGGATNKGVTIATWRSVGYDKDGDGDIDVDDLKKLTDNDVRDRVLKPHYWDKCKADKITSQSVANLIVDWAWASGPVNAVKRVQRLFGLTADGIVGPKTLAVLNGPNPGVVFNKILTARRAFIENLCREKPSQLCFRAGWLRRLESIRCGQLVYNGGQTVTFPA